MGRLTQPRLTAAHRLALNGTVAVWCLAAVARNQRGLTAAHRLALLGAVAVWFLTAVARNQRDYQDQWILDDVVWPFIGFVGVYLVLLAVERDNRVVAALSSMTIAALALVPGLKYRQPYGTTIDATSHFVLVDSLESTGRVLPGHVYESIPGMHAWLASLGLTSGWPAAGVLRFGLPLLAAILPLLAYVVCRRAQMPDGLGKLTIALTVVAAYPSFLPNGTMFTLVPLVALFAVLAVRELAAVSASARRAYTIVAVVLLAQLVLWHSTTPMFVPIFLGAAAFTPTLVRLASGVRPRLAVAPGLIRFAALSLAVFMAYRLIASDRVLHEIVEILERFVTGAERPGGRVPGRLFDIEPLDTLRVTVLIHGRAFVLIALAALGVVAIWRCRRRLELVLPFYAYFTILFSVSLLVVAVAAAGGLEYRRFLVWPVALAPFLAAPALWSAWSAIRSRGDARARGLRLAGAAAAVTVIAAVFVIEYFRFQPLAPTAGAITAAARDTYVVSVQEVNSAYQERMLTFAEARAQPGLRFAADIRGQRQFIRYFGPAETARRRLYLPLYRRDVNAEALDLVLMHWPGPAGGFDEKVEFRTEEAIGRLRELPEWSLIYDNGGSFILRSTRGRGGSLS